MAKTVDERFDEKWVLDEDGCHIWTASTDKDGYGYFSLDRKLVRPHRFAYERAHGPIPPGMVIDHLCRKRACTRVECLEVVTVKENTMRGIGPAAQNAAKTHCKNGHPFSGENLEEFKGERICKKCKAEKYKRWYDKHRKAR